MPKNKNAPCLPQHMLLQLVNALADRHGFRRIVSSELTAMYSNTKIPMPIMLRKHDGTLWIDRYYVAVQHGNGDVRYIYLTEQHINEEIYNYRVLKKCRENPPALPKVIAAQFRLALRRIRGSGVPIYISREVEGLGLMWAKELRKNSLTGVNRTKPEFRMCYYGIDKKWQGNPARPE